MSNIKDIKGANEIIVHELIHLLIYNTKRVHKVFQNKLSLVQFMLSIPRPQLILKMPQESRTGWHYTGVDKLIFFAILRMLSFGNICQLADGYGRVAAFFYTHIITKNAENYSSYS